MCWQLASTPLLIILTLAAVVGLPLLASGLPLLSGCGLGVSIATLIRMYLR